MTEDWLDPDERAMADQLDHALGPLDHALGETSRHYAPDGSPLSFGEWAALFERRRRDFSPESWWRKETKISDELRVSTVWLGLDHSWGGGSPLFWETMIFGGVEHGELWRYSSRAEAFDHHEEVVRQQRSPLRAVRCYIHNDYRDG